jgi:poly(ADP-ribose) glycohydrolase
MRKRTIDNLKSELITFQRVSLKENNIPNWEKSSVELCDVIIDKGKNIEDCENMLQVDFANKYLGGGVLRAGCVQEEIRFVINPELFVSMIFTQQLDHLESAFIIGVERTSKFKGYGRSFKYNGDHNDSYIKFDKWNRRLTEIVALDATHYNPSLKKYIQFSGKETLREMNKLYTGFKENEYSILKKGSYIATGNWGCGAYNGDLELKSLLQILVASVAGKNIYYCPFDKVEFADHLGEVILNLKQHNITTDLLYKLIKTYNNEVVFRQVNQNSQPKITLFNYIMETLRYN